MIAAGLIGLSGLALPFLGAVVIAVMAIIRRRGGAQVMGILGAALIVLAIVFPLLLSIIGLRAGPVAPDAMASDFYGNAVFDFTLEFTPGILMGAGVILAVVSVVKGQRRRQAHAPRQP